jgi:hypothetical protein
MMTILEPMRCENTITEVERRYYAEHVELRRI